MITREFPIDLPQSYSYEYDVNKIVYFDIETTGFSAEMSYLYLMGCIYHKDSSFHLIQWFSEDIREEALVITSFFEFLKNYEVLVHYNGAGFDIPYLLRKCILLNLNYSFDSIIGIDIYKRILPYKRLFNLTNYRQKSIEAFLGIKREDVFDGGDLIPIYQSYLGKKHIELLKNARNMVFTDNQMNKETILAGRKPASESEMLLGQLLLHNEDDVMGLVLISPILSYIDLFEKPIRILQADVEEGQLTISFELSVALPVGISYGKELIYFSAHDNTASLSVPIYEGELKYFYDNYKDYYYLPEEDTVIHKSLASYVDPNYRKKAKPSNCYTKKSGIFAPQYEVVLTPSFKHAYQDRLFFIEIHTDFLLREDYLERYVSHILMHLLTSKTP